MTDISTLFRNALRPGYLRVMGGKLVQRLTEPAANEEEVAQWCRSVEIPMEDWARKLDPALWDRASDFARVQQEAHNVRNDIVGLGLRSGGAYGLIYFLTRLLKPKIVVETGVCAGFSSRAFLTAMRDNGVGHLYSSDFPLFRLENPEQHVGYVVEQDLRDRWTLDIRGDRVALKRYARELNNIDLLHYDSDKRFSGRSFAFSVLKERLAPDALIVFDDIQDNWHFREFSKGRRSLVFYFEAKWVGLVGGPDKFYD